MTDSTANPSASQDKLTKGLKWLAFGAVGLYLWRANKIESKKAGVENLSGLKIGIDSEKALGYAFEVIPPLKKMNPMVKMGVMEFLKGFNKGKE